MLRHLLIIGLLILIGCSAKDPVQPGNLKTIELSRDQISLTAYMNATLPQEQVNITDISGGTVHWEVMDTVAWITVSPDSGSGNGVITLQFNIIGMPPGNYQGVITVADKSPNTLPQTVIVLLTIPAIIPLSIGNSWSYELYAYDIGNPIPIDTVEATVQVMDTVRFGSELWYETWTIFYDLSNPVDTLMYFRINRTDGSHWSMDPSSDSYLHLRFPATIGLNFTGLGGFLGFYLSQSPVRVVSTNTQVTIPLGEFTCYDYRVFPDDPNYLYHEFFSPNIGLIKKDWQRYDAIEGWYRTFLIELRQVTLQN